MDVHVYHFIMFNKVFQAAVSRFCDDKVHVHQSPDAIESILMNDQCATPCAQNTSGYAMPWRQLI